MLKRIALLPVLWALLAVGCGGGSTVAYGRGPNGPVPPPPSQDAGGLMVTATEPPRPPLDATGWVRQTPAANGVLRAFTDPGELPYMHVASRPSERLPLERTAVKARLTGFVAEVEVTQTYGNGSAGPIEAVYVFPLPANSAVNDMRMVIGEREIVAQIQERGEARRIYAEAKRHGFTTALLEQERPNVFTQSVANIEPGKKLQVVLRYVQDLSYDAGQYEFVFPMVVGPRFDPGQPLARPASGAGTHADTTQVPDASRISPPIVGQGERSGHDIALEVVADGSLAVGEFEAPTHEVATHRAEDGTFQLKLSAKDSLPNRDFVLRYRVTGAEPKATLFASPPVTGAGYFSLVVHPPELDVDGLVGRREIIFVVDVSGSMSGTPLGLCRSAMRQALSGLRPVDTFNILTFSGATQAAFPQPRTATQANVRQALRVVDELRAGGGTYMADAVRTALSDTVAPGRSRYVFFMTDGYVGNEAEIIATAETFVRTIEARGQKARVFAFGVGSSTNRYLIDGLSKAGKGLGVYASKREDPARAVNRFYHYIDQPILTGVRIDWGGLGVQEVFPAEIPDLFASHPIILHGRYTGNAASSVVVHAQAGARELAVPATVRSAQSKGDVVDVQGALWARAKVGALEELLWERSDESVKRDITRLGLDFHLATRFTSFVAVDSSRRVGTGQPRTVVQPVEGPEGVDVAMAGGVRTKQRAVAAGHPGATTASAGLAMEKEEVDRKAQAAPSSADASEAGAGAPPPLASQAKAEQGGEPSAPNEEVYVVQQKRGCGCRVGAREPGGARMGALGLGLLAALTLWGRRGRRRRRAESGRRSTRIVRPRNDSRGATILRPSRSGP
jgi:Ca-activated chloride channel homolog